MVSAAVAAMRPSSHSRAQPRQPNGCPLDPAGGANVTGGTFHSIHAATARLQVAAGSSAFACGSRGFVQAAATAAAGAPMPAGLLEVSRIRRRQCRAWNPCTARCCCSSAAAHCPPAASWHPSCLQQRQARGQWGQGQGRQTRQAGRVRQTGPGANARQYSRWRHPTSTPSRHMQRITCSSRSASEAGRQFDVPAFSTTLRSRGMLSSSTTAVSYLPAGKTRQAV